MIALTTYTWQIIAICAFIFCSILNYGIIVSNNRKNNNGDLALFFSSIFYIGIMTLGFIMYYNAGTYSEIFK